MCRAALAHSSRGMPSFVSRHAYARQPGRWKKGEAAKATESMSLKMQIPHTTSCTTSQAQVGPAVRHDRSLVVQQPTATTDRMTWENSGDVSLAAAEFTLLGCGVTASHGYCNAKRRRSSPCRASTRLLVRECSIGEHPHGILQCQCLLGPDVMQLRNYCLQK